MAISLPAEQAAEQGEARQIIYCWWEEDEERELSSTSNDVNQTWWRLHHFRVCVCV